MNSSTKKYLPTAALCLVAALFLGVWLCSKGEALLGDKYISVRIVHQEPRPPYSTQFYTSAETLAEALLERELVEGEDGPFGLYIRTADGEWADESRQEWWCITKNGESLTTGASDTLLADGDQYQLEFTIGYD